MFREFKEFVARGNAIELAVGIMIGAAFNRIVTALVEGILMPPIGLITNRIDFLSLFVVLDQSKGIPASLTEAKEKGIPVIAYGAFINEVITFLLVALIIFLIVRQVNRLWSRQQAAEAGQPTTKACPRCLSTIPLKATRCRECAVDLQAA